MTLIVKARIMLLISSIMLLASCQGGKPIPSDCLKLLSTHKTVMNKMYESGRFADDFMEKHETQYRMMEFLATTLGRSKNEEKRKEEIERCQKAYAVVGPQLEQTKLISVIPESELEKRFSPPLGFNRRPSP